MVSIELQIKALPVQIHMIHLISTVKWMYRMSNNLLGCPSQRVIRVFGPNIELLSAEHCVTH